MGVRIAPFQYKMFSKPILCYTVSYIVSYFICPVQYCIIEQYTDTTIIITNYYYCYYYYYYCYYLLLLLLKFYITNMQDGKINRQIESEVHKKVDLTNV